MTVELARGLAPHLAARVEQLRTPDVNALLGACGLALKDAPTVVLSATRELHVWAAGAEEPWLPRAAQDAPGANRTVCGLAVHEPPYTRAPRGLWRHLAEAGSARCCEACSYVRDGSPGWKDLRAAKHDPVLAPQRRERLRAAVTRDMLALLARPDAPRCNDDGAALYAHASERFFAHTCEVVADGCASDGEQVLKRLLGRDQYLPLRERNRSAALNRLVDRETWRVAVEQLLNDDEPIPASGRARSLIAQHLHDKLSG